MHFYSRLGSWDYCAILCCLIQCRHTKRSILFRIFWILLKDSFIGRRPYNCIEKWLIVISVIAVNTVNIISPHRIPPIILSGALVNLKVKCSDYAYYTKSCYSRVGIPLDFGSPNNRSRIMSSSWYVSYHLPKSLLIVWSRKKRKWKDSQICDNRSTLNGWSYSPPSFLPRFVLWNNHYSRLLLSSRYSYYYRATR